MKKAAWIGAAVVVPATLWLVFFRPWGGRSEPDGSAAVAPKSPKPAVMQDAVPPDDGSRYFDAFGTAKQPPEADVFMVERICEHYRQAHGEVPPGFSHEEMVAALKTPAEGGKRALLSGKERFLNKSSQWLDRWGTPFLFHKVSSQKVDVRSAGPDRSFWTTDDVTSVSQSPVLSQSPPDARSR
jgi:hypothetical protein